VTEQFTVSENQQFFAVFKHYDDLTEIIHEDWFEWGSDNYGNEALIPASGKVLSGKVVMPSIFKGKKVTRIGNFANSKITHLLCAKDSQLEVISETAF
jgi:hypothetical protein